MKTDLFARVFLHDGRNITIGHFIDEIGERMCNYSTLKHTEMKRRTFLKLLEELKKDPRVIRIETWNGLDRGEYINIHTGEVEQLWGFKTE